MRKIILLMSCLIYLSLVSAPPVSSTPVSSTPAIQTGADQTDLYLPLLKNKKVGLLVNHTARVGKKHLVDVLLDADVTITKIFVPEHGLSGQAEDGAIIKNSQYRGIPVISL